MNASATNGAKAPDAFFPPLPCPPDAPCASTTNPVQSGAQRPARQRGKLPAEVWANDEAATLIEAAAAAADEVARARPRIDSALTTLTQRAADAGMRLADLTVFASSHQLLHAHIAQQRLVDRHADDGPEDRRRKLGWVKWLAWPTVIAAGCYDTWFFSAVFRTLIDASTRLNDPGFWLSFFPGVMITVALLVTAHWTAQAALRRNDVVERSEEHVRWWSHVVARIRHMPPKVDRRKKDSLPWPRWLRVLLFGGLTIVTLGLWAVTRGITAEQSAIHPDAPAVQVPPGSVALLLLLFSIAAIAIKMLHFNPFAASESEIVDELKAAERRRDEVVRAAQHAVAAQRQALAAVTSLLDELTERVRRRMNEAIAEILRQRAGHGLSGDEAPQFSTSQPDPAGGSGGLLNGMLEPPVNLDPIRSAREAARSHDIDTVEQSLGELMRDLHSQVSAAHQTATV